MFRARNYICDWAGEFFLESKVRHVFLWGKWGADIPAMHHVVVAPKTVFIGYSRHGKAFFEPQSGGPLS